MKYLKLFIEKNSEYEKRELLIKDSKRLLQFFNKLFESLGYDYAGYDYAGYLENNSHTSEYRKSGDYIFSIKFYSREKISFEISRSLANIDPIVDALSQIIQTIKGVKIMNIGVNYISFDIKNVDNIINNLSKEDLEVMIQSNKFNL